MPQQCPHHIDVGQPCLACNGGIATRKRARANTVNNLQAQPAHGPPQLGVVPVQPAGPVHLPQAQAVPIGPANVAVGQQLVALHQSLLGTANGFRLACTQGLVSLPAVCWNWVLRAAANDAEEDPAWAYLFVKRSTLSAAETLACTAALQDGAVAALLNGVRTKVQGWPRFPSVKATKEAHAAVLEALLLRHGLRLLANSPLVAVVWFHKNDAKNIMYHHMEFRFIAGNQCTTITKGSNELVQAYCGTPVFGADFLCTWVGVDPTSLHPRHLQVLDDLYQQGEALPPPQPPAKRKKTRR